MAQGPLRCGISIRPMTAMGHFRQIETLPALAARTLLLGPLRVISRHGAILKQCPLYPRMCCKTRLFVAIGFGREFLAMPCPVLPMREYGLNASVPKLDATPTLSKRRPPVAAHGKEA